MTKWSDWIFANYRSLLRIIHTNLSLNTTHHHINTVCMFLFSSWPDHIIWTVCNWSKRELLHINFIPFHWFVFHMQYPFEYFQQHSSINTLGRNTSSHKYHLVPSTTPAHSLCYYSSVQCSVQCALKIINRIECECKYSVQMIHFRRNVHPSIDLVTNKPSTFNYLSIPFRAIL